MTAFEQRIHDYMDAGFPILYLNTYEDTKAREAIKAASAHINNVDILLWDDTDAICDICTGAVKYEKHMLLTISDFLDERMGYKKRQILILQNIETFINDPAAVARLNKLAALVYEGLDTTVCIISPVVYIPREIEKYVTVVEMDYLTTNEIENIISSFADEWDCKVGDKQKRDLANALKGLTELEISNILSLAYSRDNDLKSSQKELIFEQKRQMIKKAGILEMIQVKEDLNSIGGLENLKTWLKQKEKVFSDMDRAQQFGVDIPKGVLITGIPGCGKSLSAKATATLLNVPLLRLDMGRLLGKYVGESESNMRKAIQLAEAISPCVLWVDELEKAFSGIGGDGSGAEVTTRLLGSFLTWLQEKESPVFVIATANDITKLPPELLRKGRFDEIFYVGLPNREERRSIFEIHIKKRRPNDFPDIEKTLMNDILDQTEGYSGADIEGVVRESVELAFFEDKDKLDGNHIRRVLKNTHSLSEIMREPIERMEKEYKSRQFKNASL